jgi:hypothetical protein
MTITKVVDVLKEENHLQGPDEARQKTKPVSKPCNELSLVILV